MRYGRSTLDGTALLKILHIIARLNIGGTTPYVIQLIAQQRAMGHTSHLVCGMVGSHEGDMRYLAEEKGIDLINVPSLGRDISLLRDLRTLYDLWRLIRRERPDVVHTHTSKAGFVGRLAAWLAGVPVIVHTFHGHVFAGYFSPLKTGLYLWLERFCAWLSTSIIVLSSGLQHELVERYRVARRGKVRVVPLGFDLSAYAAIEADDGTFRASLNIPADAPLIGIVGRLVPIKNHEMFLRAAALIVKTLPQAMFVIVGDGEVRAALEAHVATLGLAPHVRFAGWITKLVPVYCALDVAVCTSINEGLPVNLIEALAAGVPIVATRVGGVPDLLDNGALGAIIDLNDDPALVAGVIAAVHAGKGTPAVRQAREAALVRYSIQQSAALTEQVYRSP
jgi:glycosyltransferase involved in cell wall biosynthesis